MDLSFGIARQRRAVREPVRLDFPRLIAILAATQAASRTAEIAGQLARSDRVSAGPVEALVILFAPESGRSEAARVLGGSFNREVAVRR